MSRSQSGRNEYSLADKQKSAISDLVRRDPGLTDGNQPPPRKRVDSGISTMAAGDRRHGIADMLTSIGKIREVRDGSDMV
jgi:hypothetical protein